MVVVMSNLLAAYLYDTLRARRKRRGARALAFRRFVEASLARGPSSRRSHRASPRRAPRLPFPSPPRLSGRFRRTRDGAPLVPQLPRELERRLLRRRRREVERAPASGGPTAAAADPDPGLLARPTPFVRTSFEGRSNPSSTAAARRPRSRTRAAPDDGGSPFARAASAASSETMPRRRFGAAAPPPPPPAVLDAARADSFELLGGGRRDSSATSRLARSAASALRSSSVELGGGGGGSKRLDVVVFLARVGVGEARAPAGGVRLRAPQEEAHPCGAGTSPPRRAR